MIVTITSQLGLGGTFLDWSLHWLSGATNYYNHHLGSINLTQDPVTDINAHNHQRNHTTGSRMFDDVVERLNQSTNSLYSIYAFPLMIDGASKELNISVEQAVDDHSDTVDYINLDYAKIWNHCAVQNFPIIYLHLTRDFVYNLTPRLGIGAFFPTATDTIKSLSLTPTEIRSAFRADFVNIFFKPSNKKQWTNDAVWDQREYLALNLRPFDSDINNQYIDFTLPHMYLDVQRLWYHGEDTMRDIFNYLGLTIDPSRIDHWKIVYAKWQQIQLKILKFVWSIDHICNCIINNYYYDLVQHELDLWQEAAILHVLIYKYNKNIKGWGMVKFPNNTQDLHKLLEENIHIVDNIYNRDIK